MTPDLRVFIAENPGPFTLDGTRTYLVGRARVAIVDPGPDQDAHLARLAEAVADADSVVLLVTHPHGDHAAGAARLGNRIGAEVRGYAPGARPLGQGERVETDAGPLIPLDTPGHTRDHLAFLWEDPGFLFVGDLLLGLGHTTWVAEYPGCVADYLSSLDLLASTNAVRLLPAHGPPLEDPAEAIERFRAHRLSRIEEVRRAVSTFPGSSREALLDAVYGRSLPEGTRSAALRSLDAILHHLGD